MDKCSGLLERIMLGIFMALLALALVLAAIQGFESPSYIMALALGLIAAVLLAFLWRRAEKRLAELCRGIKGWKLGLAVWSAVFLLGMIWALPIRIEPFSDYKTYWDCAVSLAFGREIYSTEYVAMYPHILGYASFLAPFIKVFGENVMVGVVLGQLLSTFSGLLIYLISAGIMGRERGLLAALLWALYPGRIMLGSLIFSEPLYSCLLLLLLYLIMLLQRKQDGLRFPAAALWGLGLGLLLWGINTVRPIGPILVIALLIWLLLLRGKDMRSLRLWKLWGLILLLMLGSFQLCSKGWERHLERVLGQEVAGLPIYNLYVGFNMDTLGQWSAEDMDLLFEYRRQEGGSAPEAQKAMLPHVLERIGEDDMDFTELFKSKLFVFLGNDELGGYTYRFTRSPNFVKLCMALCNCYYYMVCFLALLGLGKMMKGGYLSSLDLLPLYALGLTLAHMLIEVSSRYHYSLIPILVIFAALGCAKTDRKEEKHEL